MLFQTWSWSIWLHCIAARLRGITKRVNSLLLVFTASLVLSHDFNSFLILQKIIMIQLVFLIVDHMLCCLTEILVVTPALPKVWGASSLHLIIASFIQDCVVSRSSCVCLSCHYIRDFIAINGLGSLKRHVTLFLDTSLLLNHLLVRWIALFQPFSISKRVQSMVTGRAARTYASKHNDFDFITC